MKWPAFLLFCATMLTLNACTKPGGANKQAAVKTEILALEKTFVDEVAAKGEGPAFARFMDETQGRIFRNRPEPLTGTAAISAYYGPRDPNSSLSWTPSDVIVAKSADLAVSYGRWLYRAPVQSRQGQSSEGQSSQGQTMRESRGAYVTVWRKNAKGEWKGVVDMGQPDAPLPDSTPLNLNPPSPPPLGLP